MTGWSSTGEGQYTFDYATVAYDAATGERLWTRRYEGEGHDGNRPNALVVSPDGTKVFVTGQNRLRNFATVAYDAATGSQIWVARRDGSGNFIDGGVAIAVSPDGAKAFVTGGLDGKSSEDYLTIEYDAATGTSLWERRYDGPTHGWDVPSSLALDPSGSRVFVTGESDGKSGDWDYATVAYDTTDGDALWVSRYNGTSSHGDVARAVGVSPDGSEVFVTGSSPGTGTGNDYATLAYDAATGARLWLDRYSGGDTAYALAVSGDGSKVFVTGSPVTIAYAAR